MLHYTYKNGDKVSFNQPPLRGSGIIKGVSTAALPVIGATYIIELTSCNIPTPNDTYPFSCIAIAELFITKDK